MIAGHHPCRFSLGSLFLLAVGLTPAALTAQQPRILPDGYRVETIPTPKGVAFGVGGMSFAKDGTLFVCTREGQVWTRRGSTWALFAEGLHEPLGILVTPEDRVFVIQRPELTELIDADGDGRVDQFKTVSAGWGLTDNYHEYAFGLERDAEGNFYGTLNTTLSWKGWAGSSKWDIARVHDSKMGRAAKYRGWSFRITPAGEFEPWSSGLRSPAGLCMTPAGELFYTDNQGDWNATSSLHFMPKGRFHGHPSSLTDHPDYLGKNLEEITVEQYDALRVPPAVWFPHGDLANSPGEPVVDTTAGRFGPFAGQMFVGDQSRSNVFRVVVEKVGGEYQGCAINFVDHLQAGVVRNRFAADGSLWVGQTGRGWGSRGPAKYGIQRIVWDGKTVPFAIHRVSLGKAGFRLRFTQELDRNRAARTDSYSIQSWRYAYQPAYGSKKFDKAEDPVDRVVVGADGRGVDLFVGTLKPGRIYQIQVTAPAASGDRMASPVAWYTLNRLRDE